MTNTTNLPRPNQTQSTPLPFGRSCWSAASRSGSSSFSRIAGKASALIAALSLTLIAQTSSAYTLTTTNDQHPVKFRYGQKLYLAGNPSRPGGFPAASFQSLVVNALSQWKWATQGMFDFDYWQGTDPSVYAPNSARNGLSSIYFASNSKEATDPNVIGYTQVWYNANSGDILEADVLLNDRNYDLTTTVQDSSSNRSAVTGYKPKVFVGNIITHELGHALGLSHSGNINASMLYVEYPEQNKIGCDDFAGARHLYPAPGGGQGSLKGTVVGPAGDGVAGAAVTAISQTRGIPIASVLTDQYGQFEFGALEVGNVALMIEKFQGASSTVPLHVQARVTQKVCNGNAFPTQFADVGDGHQLREFLIQPQNETQTGVIRLQCAGVANLQNQTLTLASSHFAVDQAPSGATRTFRFFANGPFQVSGIGHLLLSPVKVSLQALDANGRAIATQGLNPLYRSNSQFQIEDSVITGNATGWVTIKATTSTIASTRFPSPAIWPSQIPYFVIAVQPNANQRPASSMPVNARCAPPENLPAYTSPEGGPVRNYPDQTSRDAMGCSAAHADELHGPTHRDTGSILGRLMPFLLIGLAYLGQLYFSQRARKLGT